MLTRSPNCTCQVRVANAVRVCPPPQTAGRICWRVAVVPGLFMAGYAAVKAMVQPRPPGLVAITLNPAWAWS